MKVAVLSDIHDNIWNLEKALQKIKELACEQIIFCGDFCAPFTAEQLAEAGIPINAVFGNNDGDKENIVQGTIGKIAFALGQEYAELEIDNQKIAFCHYPQTGKILAESGKYDVVFHGHNHLKNSEVINQTLLCNPGPVCGIILGKEGPASFAIYETNDGKISFVEL